MCAAPWAQLPMHAPCDDGDADDGTLLTKNRFALFLLQGKELDSLLLESVTSPRDAVRLCAVQWANRLFPLDHVEVGNVTVYVLGC